MPCRCCVTGCEGSYSKKLRVFAFPKDPDLLKKWLKALNQEDFQPRSCDKICGKHFKPGDVNTKALKRWRLKPNSVPCVFENESVTLETKTVLRGAVLKENQERNITKSTNMPKSPKVTSSETDSNTSKSPIKQLTERSPIKTRRLSSASDKPIIALVKDKDAEVSSDIPQEIISDSEDDDDCIIEDEPKIPSSAILPASLKDLPTVAVCLKEEDRVPFIRELKGVKRSSSTGSNSSVGSSETQKAASSQKRRKIEKPAPVVIGCDNDCYCWVCHRENVHLSCIACPRAYHSKCAVPRANVNSPDWVCPECQKVLAAENVDTRSSTLSEISLDKLATLLKLSLNKMKQRAPLAFHQPVSLTHYPLYLHYVIHPMDLSLLERNIKQKLYGCTEAFLADVKWLAHNSCVFNGAQHPLSTNAKNLVKSCDHDMQEIEVCPDCFVHSVVRNKYWFSEVCRKPHPLVWAKLKGFPYWPAKVVRILDGNVDARFFGAHDRAWVPVSQCYHLSKEMPTTSKPKKKSNYEVALEELNVHVHLLVQKFKCFQYAPYRTAFNPDNIRLSYHGIDINKVAEEELCVEISESPTKTIYSSPEKENRFAKYMDAEAEKDNSDDIIIIDDSQHEDFSTTRKETNSTEKLCEDSVMELEKVKEDDLESNSNKKSNAASSSDQLRKLELALERIKGYVSLDVDSEREDGKSAEEGEETENKSKVTDKLEKNSPKDSPEKTIKEPEVKSKLSPLFKDLFTLPNIEKVALPNVASTSNASENISTALETKKTDSFFLKLNETIQSCKAKLGISEINDNISDNESAVDENASKSDEDDETSSASEAGEENSSMSETENIEGSDDDENGEASDEEIENAQVSNESADKDIIKYVDSSDAEESGESDNESEAETRSESSDTDVEADKAKSSPNKKLTESRTHEDDNSSEIIFDDSISSDKPNSQVSKNFAETCDVSVKKTVKSVSPNKSEIDGKLPAQGINKSCDTTLSSQKSPIKNKSLSETIEDSVMNIDNDSIRNSAKDNEHSLPDSSSLSKVNELSPTKLISEQQKKAGNVPVNTELTAVKNVPMQLQQTTAEISTTTSQSTADDSDDEIITCPVPRPKTPPVIFLDDDDADENCVQDSSMTNTNEQSTNSDFSNTSKATVSQENAFSPRNRSINGTVSKSLLVEGTLQSKNVSAHGRKRTLNASDDSSGEDDDEVREVAPQRKRLTGAIRTFKKHYNQITPSITPKKEVDKAEPEKENFSPQKSPASFDGSKSDSDTREETYSPTRILLRNSVLDTSHLKDKDKEILFLKNKLRCVLRAYHIQQWKCKQERDELRHNMNLVIMEMRTCMEADKKSAVESLSQKFEQEKLKVIEEAKQKQWCATCRTESRYACCWNTSYCSYVCQKQHFPEHRSICTQVKNKNSDAAENKQASAHKPNDGSDKPKKVIIVNVNNSSKVSPDGSSTSANSHQTVANNAQQIQVVSSKNSSQPGSVTPYIFITPMKTSSETSKSLSLVSAINQTKTVTSSSTPVSTTLSSEPATTTLSTLAPGTISFVITAPTTTASGQTLKPVLLPKPATSISDISSTASNSELPDSNVIFKGLKEKSCSLKTAIKVLTKKNLVASAGKNLSEEQAQTDLEEIYFPSPPAVTFEGYESISPEPTLVIDDSEKVDDVSDDEEIIPVQDITLSDGEENDEMVNIGHGIDVKAGFLNKCLVYGTTAPKLTRCLVDVIFQDIKLLASCSAFGQKSNVTKFTRCALPTRKVFAIIDYVNKRFPGASRSEVILAINRKCKEARMILNRTSKDSNPEDKKEVSHEDLGTTPNTTTATILAAPKTQSTNLFKTVTSPNLVSLKSPKSYQEIRFSVPPSRKFHPPILIQPKPVIKTLKPPGIVQASSTAKGKLKGNPTVKQLLSASVRNKNKQDTMAEGLEKIKITAASTVPTSTTSSTRPYIIVNAAIRQSSPGQNTEHTGAPIISVLK